MSVWGFSIVEGVVYGGAGRGDDSVRDASSREPVRTSQQQQGPCLGHEWPGVAVAGSRMYTVWPVSPIARGSRVAVASRNCPGSYVDFLQSGIMGAWSRLLASLGGYVEGVRNRQRGGRLSSGWCFWRQGATRAVRSLRKGAVVEGCESE